ncbi:hypothetical protein AVEN_267181-1 [Araneus ventricosus]|uniref:Uncharacterized protein n=1 Tax=Araneus ventricosus TaxID=182803 RepID=A0A4Y2WEP2_ARAVE|nr:hypothetical protein AVEN_267181-1 [Araneus ventricosus]
MHSIRAGTDGSRWETAALPRSRTSGAAHTTTSAAVPVDHQAYSPDLAPSDYHLLQLLKRFLAKRYLSSDDDVQTDGCHRSPRADLFDTGVQKLVSRYD